MPWWPRIAGVWLYRRTCTLVISQLLHISFTQRLLSSLVCLKLWLPLMFLSFFAFSLLLSSFYLPPSFSPFQSLFSVSLSPIFFFFFLTAQVLSTRQSVTCSLGKEASWLWFVFLLRCGAVQSDCRLTATAPVMYLAEFQNIGRHVRVRVVSVATSQQGLPREGGAAVEEKEKEGN